MPKLAAGFVLYRIVNSNFIEYLLLKASYPPYHWTPPKGHTDKHETDLIETAFRETEEESGIGEEQIAVDEFQMAIDYEARGKPKTVTYFLGKVNSDVEITLSDEHTDFIWLKCAEAVEKIGFEITGNVIMKCEEYIKKKLNISEKMQN